MLTLPDFKEKKILYISNIDDSLPNLLKFHNSNIRLYKDNKFVNQISIHLVFCVFICGTTSITTPLIRNLQEYGISIFLLTESLKPYAQINAQAEGNYILRKKQYTLADSSNLEIARSIVKNKVQNQISLLRLNKKKLPESIININSKIEKVKNIQELLGLEGSCAYKYYSLIFNNISWSRRAPRTKEDIPNLLLDIGYTFLFNYVGALLRLFGFDTYKGIYHQLFFQRESLPCDIMEPLRPLVDQQLIKSYNLKQIKEKDFKFKNGQYFMNIKYNHHYTNIWFTMIMNNKEKIYKYIYGFYRYFMDRQKNKFPIFQI
ncbi:MAG TPA: CRISPR-associated endonuclease Cas1 [Candidatus Dojkabacteria bacterium]|nr:CRISPR-associated endonuclease Cas1 [Candidatus Dojkabacteria bacterium]